MWESPQRWLRECFDWLLPPACQLCGATLPMPAHPHLCRGCRDTFPPPPSPRCPRCLLPHATPVGVDYPCEACLRQPLPIQRLDALGLYGDGLREAIHRFKFRGALGLSRPLGMLLAHHLDTQAAYPTPDLVVPVPLHPRRLRQRGYNQAQLLGREVQKVLGGSLEQRLLVRQRETTSQQGLPLAQRQENVRGAFAAPRTLEGEARLLVDDVLTTGATIRHCARTLYRAGAGTVAVAILARAPRPDAKHLSGVGVHG